MAERRLDRDRLTALEATPSNSRPAIATLWDLDLAFADVVATTTQPALGAIRMAWWRESLEELDKGSKPTEPRLKEVQAELIARGVTGIELSQLEDAWLPLLEPFPWGEGVAEGLKRRGALLFGIGARLLGGKDGDAAAEGALWSLIDGAAHCSDAQSRDYLVACARAALDDLSESPPPRVRTLTILAALAAYDLRPGGRFGRLGVALAHRLRGSMPRS